MSKKEIKLLEATAQSLTSTLNEFEEFLGTINENNLDEIIPEVEFRLSCIPEINKEYNQLYVQLSVIATEPITIMTTAEFFKKYVAINVKCNSLLNKKPRQLELNNSLASNGSNYQNVNARLSKLTVPTFDGNYTSFTSYYETFTALIHNNNTLSDVERFMYLKGSLKGPAAQLISNIQPTGENYKIAFDLLCERFNNQKLIVSNHVKGIFDLKAITKDNATEMRNLHDELNKHLRALENMPIELDYRAIFISHILMSKFDPSTRKEFSKFKIREIPTLNEINEFLKERCQTLEQIEMNKGPVNSSGNNLKSDHSNKGCFRSKQQYKQSFLLTDSKIFCPECKNKHSLNHCPTFLALTVKQRIDRTKELKICKNCLYHSNQNSCRSRYACQVCSKKHHTLLHLDNAQDYYQSSSSNSQSKQSTNQDPASANLNTQTTLLCSQVSDQVLLPTAIIQVMGANRKWYKARILLDSGSHINLITDEMVDKLQLKRDPINTKILGINSNFSSSNSVVKLSIASLCNNYRNDLSCVTIQKIADSLPLHSFKRSNLNIPANIQLADNNFNTPSTIDILIGASLFYSLLCVGQISLGKNKPILQKTIFGWIVSGNYSFDKNSKHQDVTRSNLILNDNVEESIQDLQGSVERFWQIENVHPKHEISKLSPEEQFCERLFQKTITRDHSGRFIVSIPFNAKLSELGDSKNQAFNRFLHLEAKLLKNPDLQSEYAKFIHEYIELGHMKLCDNSARTNSESREENAVTILNSTVPLPNIPEYFLPHHAVVKASSLTTKLRVVFDGSAKSSTNISLNDAQIAGPVIQNDIFSILINFRQHLIAITADIEKMYRQFLIHPSLRKLQQIFWRDEPNQPVSTYQLQTITYGTKSASYLATKCLQHLAELSSVEFPIASEKIKREFYMDDWIGGSDTIEDVLKIKTEVATILASAGLIIRKFLSNRVEIISTDGDVTPCYYNIPLGERENVKTLGISWNALADFIQYDFSIKSECTRNTKRVILSELSKLYDPIGLLSPFIVKGKLIMQRLWQLRLAWDESIPEDSNTEWIHFRDQLLDLKLLKIPRCVKIQNAVNIQLHGFTDSSSVAYGACVYVRSQDVANNVSINLLCAKSRIAPLHGVTIPRLELCSAVLLVQLIDKVKESLTINVSSVFLWTDSTIVLHWINSAPNKYKTFVSNRIATIQELSERNQWYHVRSSDNPADLISRGASVNDLLHNTIWFFGPKFLSLPREQWPNQTIKGCILPATEFKIKENADAAMNFLNIRTFNIFDEFSELIKLKRVVAWIIRFKNNSKSSKDLRISGPLKVVELLEAFHMLVKLCQAEYFEQEIRTLQNNQILKTKSNILSLNPFIDSNHILRVGGRIKNSDYSFDKKFPILLPKDHALTKLIFKDFHEKLQHCGAQQLLACVREQYWPISGRNSAKNTVRNCINCFKTNPRSYNPLMADLPSKRLQPSMPVFSNVGIDYAGPILIKDRKARGAKLIKAYICLFVCLVTKAIHLELVTNLTADAFIATLKRFISRRGKPISISSDNAKYFVGATNQLRDLYKFLNSKQSENEISDFLSDQNIKWDFIIPRSPHQGGIWESGVKSTKLLLKRVLGNASLTFEDFYTLLTQIEATLNSRPLSPISDNPSDLNPLTPGHFIIGKPLYALPEASYIDVPENRLSCYQNIQRLVQMFWKRWSREVIPELQKRTKWFENLPNLVHIGSIVLIQEEGLQPLQWSLGRVTEIHPSSDNIPRSVTLITASGKAIKRTVHKICVLPGV